MIIYKIKYRDIGFEYWSTLDETTCIIAAWKRMKYEVRKGRGLEYKIVKVKHTEEDVGFLKTNIEDED